MNPNFGIVGGDACGIAFSRPVVHLVHLDPTFPPACDVLVNLCDSVAEPDIKLIRGFHGRYGAL